MTAVAFTDPAGHAYPALHAPVHALDAEPPVPNRPASHGPWHVLVLAPAAEPNRPGSHGEQDDDPTPENVPAGHCDTVAVVDPAGQMKPAEQSPVQDAEPMPGAAPNLPAGHSKQILAPAKL